MMAWNQPNPHHSHNFADDLPPGWERLFDSYSGMPYYANHNNRTTTWVHPRSPQNMEIPIQYPTGGYAPSPHSSARLSYPDQSHSVMRDIPITVQHSGISNLQPTNIPQSYPAQAPLVYPGHASTGSYGGSAPGQTPAASYMGSAANSTNQPSRNSRNASPIPTSNQGYSVPITVEKSAQPDNTSGSRFSKDATDRSSWQGRGEGSSKVDTSHDPERNLGHARENIGSIYSNAENPRRIIKSENDDTGSVSGSSGKSPGNAVTLQLKEISNIVQQAEKLQGRVSAFRGSKSDSEYIFLDEMLTRGLLLLDNIDSNGNDEVRTARRNAVRTIQQMFDEMELKIIANGADDVVVDTCQESPSQGDERSAEDSRDVNTATKEGMTGVKEMLLESEVSC